jgi:hypothetical protein
MADSVIPKFFTDHGEVHYVTGDNGQKQFSFFNPKSTTHERTTAFMKTFTALANYLPEAQLAAGNFIKLRDNLSTQNTDDVQEEEEEEEGEEEEEEEEEEGEGAEDKEEGGEERKDEKKRMVKHLTKWNQIKRRLLKQEMLTLQTKLQETTKTASTQRFSMCTERNRSSGLLSSSASSKATPTSRFTDFGTPKAIARPPFPPGYLALAPTDFRLQMTLTSCAVLPRNV